MKKIILSAVMIVAYICLYAQRDEKNWDTITFESPYQYLKMNTSGQNIWEIGTPNKIFFNSAYTGSSAIITGKTATYPVNNYSYFDLYIGNYNINWYPHSIFIEIHHKYDTDSLKDGGYITISRDRGKTWVNLIDDFWKFNDIAKENIYSSTDTLFNGENGYSGKSNGWITTRFCWYDLPLKIKSANYEEDTMIIRFNFISDNINNNKEGWIIDDIRLYSVDLGDGFYKREPGKLAICPNPVTNTCAVYLPEKYTHIELEMTDIKGTVKMKQSYVNTQIVTFGRDKLKPGIYLLKIKTEKGILGIQKINIK